MSGGGTTNTVSQSTIPSQILPYYQQALSQGQNLLNSGGPQYYPGQQVAPLNPLQEQGLTAAQQGYGAAQQAYAPTMQGLGQIEQTAMGPNASQGAQAANMFETSGALLNPSSNPYLQGTFNQAANQVQNQLSSEFAGSGRNIIASAPVQSDSLNNLATQLYGGAYNQGLQTMTQASALAPSIDQGTYLPGNELMAGSGQALNNNAGVLSAGNNALQAGAGLQGQTQNQINANMNAWNYNQQLPYNQLSWYSGLLGQNAAPFKSQTGQTSGTSNPWATAGGAALIGSSLYGSGALGALGSGISGLLGGAADIAPYALLTA